ncbi:unnamed protein product [Schistocephalus solidus]|uniref:Helicase C-terminal domain-containing protein n=1 Tax=Schistocephalus solidus TaxID=70667 RepID=A0A183TE53_SCHSO|nr:unnamed protein product [Schistocephalus solidus]
MQFEDANPKKFKRILQQCMRVMEEFGPWCADMNRHGIPLNTKLKMYKAVVLTTLFYGAETWTVYSSQFWKLYPFHLSCLCRILKLRWQGMEVQERMLRHVKLRWSGHLVKMDDERLPKRLLYGDVATGSRRQGGQQLRYKENFKKSLRQLQINPATWEDLAQDRPAWIISVKTGAAIYESNRIAAAKAERAVCKSQAPDQRRQYPSPANMPTLSTHIPRACQLTEKAFTQLAASTSTIRGYNAECLSAIRECLATLGRAHELYTTIRDGHIARARRPSSSSDTAWGEWILAHIPMTNKVVQLVRLLTQFKNRPPPAEQSASGTPEASAFHALVLVKERITTSALCRLICELSAMAPQYSGLKASYCVSANPTRNLASMSTGEQLDVLAGFRKGAFNVLVATDVIEEGLDVRACNVVIKVDPVTNFRSFIQSQGRARAAHSHYVLMTEDKTKCQLTVESFRRLERDLTVALRDRCVDTVEYEDVSESPCKIAKLSYLPFGGDGPRITPSSAGSVLMRYVSTLKTDASYTLKILYSHQKVSLGGFQVQLLLPPPCPLQEIISVRLLLRFALALFTFQALAILQWSLSGTKTCIAVNSPPNWLNLFISMFGSVLPICTSWSPSGTVATSFFRAGNASSAQV